MLFDDVIQGAVSNCTSCGLCVEVCPCIPVSKIADIHPQEISDTVLTYLKEGLFSAVTAERALACSRCGVCLEVCPEGINVYALQEALRMKLIAQDRIKMSLANLTVGNRLLDSWDIDDILVAVQLKPSERRWIDSTSSISNIRKSDRILFLGCHSRRYVSAVHTLMDIFDYVGIGVTAVAGGGVCCGARFSGIGKFDQAKEQVGKLISYLVQFGPKEVLVECPMCLYNIQRELAEYANPPFRIRHIFDSLAEKIEHISPKKLTGKKVVFHDPCKLGRMSKKFEPARKILSAVDGLILLEIPSNKEDSLCCGGAAWRSNSQVAQALRKTVMDSIRETGAEVLATACQFCYQSFGNAEAGYDYQVRGLIEIIGDALGITYENKLERYNRYHDPQRVIEESRDNIVASPYTVEEVYQVLLKVIA